jgi:hypothetical protein
MSMAGGDEWQEMLPALFADGDAFDERIRLETRFLSYVEREGECAVWRGGKTGPGRGVFFIRKVAGRSIQAYAHRVSWVLAHGPIPAGMVVCHQCDNPRCVRPDHLFLGTQKDNMQDCKAKGRMRDGARYDLATAREIRDRYNAGGITQTRLATEYGMSFQHVNSIVLGKRWAEA